MTTAAAAVSDVPAVASQHSDTFRELLARAGFSVLLSARDAGKLVVIRNGAGALNTHFVGIDHPMGIAWRPGELAIACNDRIEVFRNLSDAGPKAGQGEATDACYIPRKTHRTGSIDIHEAGYDGDSDLWFTGTRMSSLVTLSDEYSFVPRWRPPFVSAYDLNDRCHLNGIAFRDGKPRYATMLARSDTAEGWRAQQVSGGLVMDLKDDGVVADRLCLPRSPRWYRGRLWFLASGAGQLMASVPGEPPMVIAEVPGFARGLDFIDRYALVGVSRARPGAASAGMPVTRRVAAKRCGLWVIDTESGATVAFFEFTGGPDEVFDVKVLPHRYPVVLEPSSPLVASSFELPDEVLADLAPPDPVLLALEEATRSHLEGKFEEAIEGYREILKDQPDQLLASHRLGLCMVDAEHWEQAAEQLARVIETQPANAEAMNSLGMAWYRMGDLERGLAWFERSIETDNEFALAHLNRGMILLKLGRYHEAWPEYDWRWLTPKFVPFQASQPAWKGEDIADKRLLVHSEQGNGDQLQFLRFLPLAAARCRKLIYVGPETLSALVAEVPGVAESRVPGKLAGDSFDVYCPLMSLPRWLGVTLENLPAPRRYLEVPPRAVVSRLEGDFRVGLAWAGSPTQQEDKWRSAGLDVMVPLFGIEGVDFFSLQMPLAGNEVEVLEQLGVTNLEPELPGYARTAALVDQLDLVITVDTAIAHLACALGKETWILLHHDPDWRWPRQGSESAWYPSARLFRQTRAGDWESVIREVGGALIESEAGAQPR